MFPFSLRLQRKTRPSRAGSGCVCAELWIDAQVFVHITVVLGAGFGAVGEGVLRLELDVEARLIDADVARAGHIADAHDRFAIAVERDVGLIDAAVRAAVSGADAVDGVADVLAVHGDVLKLDLSGAVFLRTDAGELPALEELAQPAPLQRNIGGAAEGAHANGIARVGLNVDDAILDFDDAVAVHGAHAQAGTASEVDIDLAAEQPYGGAVGVAAANARGRAAVDGDVQPAPRIDGDLAVRILGAGADGIAVLMLRVDAECAVFVAGDQQRGVLRNVNAPVAQLILALEDQRHIRGAPQRYDGGLLLRLQLDRIEGERAVQAVLDSDDHVEADVRPPVQGDVVLLNAHGVVAASPDEAEVHDLVRLGVVGAHEVVRVDEVDRLDVALDAIRHLVEHDRPRLRYVESLDEVGAQFDHDLQLFVGLDALREGLIAVFVDEPDDAGYELPERRLGIDVRDERAVDLDAVGAVAQQVHGVGVARAEVVDRDLRAGVEQAALHVVDAVGVELALLGELDDHLLHQLAVAVRERLPIGVGEHVRGDGVDEELALLEDLLILLDDGECVFDGRLFDIVEPLRLVGAVEDLQREHVDAGIGAHEHLIGDELAALRVDDRLEVILEQVLIDEPKEAAHLGVFVLVDLILLRGIELDASVAAEVRLIEREQRVAHSLLAGAVAHVDARSKADVSVGDLFIDAHALAAVDDHVLQFLQQILRIVREIGNKEPEAVLVVRAEDGSLGHGADRGGQNAEELAVVEGAVFVGDVELEQREHRRRVATRHGGDELRPVVDGEHVLGLGAREVVVPAHDARAGFLVLIDAGRGEHGKYLALVRKGIDDMEHAVVIGQGIHLEKHLTVAIQNDLALPVIQQISAQFRAELRHAGPGFSEYFGPLLIQIVGHRYHLFPTKHIPYANNAYIFKI